MPQAQRNSNPFGEVLRTTWYQFAFPPKPSMSAIIDLRFLETCPHSLLITANVPIIRDSETSLSGGRGLCWARK